jgi:hypothetical protein
MLSAITRNEKISFSPIFGLYSDVVCLCSIHDDFFVFYFKAVVKIFKIQICSKLSSFGPPKWRVWYKKTRTKNLGPLSLYRSEDHSCPQSFSPLLSLSHSPSLSPFPSPLPSSSLSSSLFAITVEGGPRK